MLIMLAGSAVVGACAVAEWAAWHVARNSWIEDGLDYEKLCRQC